MTRFPFRTNQIADYHVPADNPKVVEMTDPVVDVERAGFLTLDKDRVAAMARMQAQADRKFRVQANADAAVIALEHCAVILRALKARPDSARQIPVTIADASGFADEVLARIEGGA